MATLIQCHRLTHSLGDKALFKSLDIAINEGDKIGLVGHNGSGKSTLLGILSQALEADEGEISLNRRLQLEVVEQFINPRLSDTTLAEALADKLPEEGKDFNQYLVEQLLAELGFSPNEYNYLVSDLSGGQQQRVALARALIKQPKVLLLDEPLGALDKKLREQMQIELRQLQQQLGITFLFVTHDQEEALTLSDRIAVMSDGEVIEIATPAELYESPSSRFVADFIGSMNFFEGEVVDSKARNTTVTSELLGTIVASEVEQEFSSGTPVWIAIRPEKLQPQFESPENQAGYLEGRMGPSAYLGDRSHFYVHIDHRDEPVLVALQNLERSLGGISRPNQPVWLTWSPDAVVVLPRN